MPKKQAILAKIEFFASFANHIEVVIKSRRPFSDWLRELLDWTRKLRLPVSLPVLLVLLVASSLLTSFSSEPTNSSTFSGVQPGIYPGQGCTIFYAADDNVALAGNNEDYHNPYTYVWFVPPEPGKYGQVYFGYDDGYPQGGVNEKGLFFDIAAIPYKDLSRPNDKPVYDGVIGRNLLGKIMSVSASVSEALAIFNSYNITGMETAQLLFGDAFGDSMIVDGDTILRKDGPFQVATNFRLSDNPEPPYTGWRYNTARDLLSKADSFSVELFRDILNATHQHSTLYSNIYDLKKGLIYLYYRHDFENVVVIDIAAETAKGFHSYRLASLFPANTEAEGFLDHRTSAYETRIAKRVTPTRLGQNTGYAGDYRVGQMGDTVRIYIEADRLYFRQPSSMPIELFSEAEGQFFHVFHDNNELSINFERDIQGDVNGATGVLYGEEFQLERLKPAHPTAQPTPVLAKPGIPISPTAIPMPVTDDSVRAIPWWGWALAALGTIAIAAVAVLKIKR